MTWAHARQVPGTAASKGVRIRGYRFRRGCVEGFPGTDPTRRYLPPTGKDGPERTVPSAPGTEGPEALPPLPHGCEVGLPRRETFDFRQPPHAKCRKGESHRCTSYTARA